MRPIRSRKTIVVANRSTSRYILLPRAPWSSSSSEGYMRSPAETLQPSATLRLATYIAPIFMVIQLALACTAPSFAGLRVYNFFLLSLIGLASGCGGWICGIVLSPIGSQASGAQKVLGAIVVFWTGIVVGHFPEIFKSIAVWQKSQLSTTSKIQLLFGLGVFLLATCVTFNTRFDSPTPA